MRYRKHRYHGKVVKDECEVILLYTLREIDQALWEAKRQLKILEETPGFTSKGRAKMEEGQRDMFRMKFMLEAGLEQLAEEVDPYMRRQKAALITSDVEKLATELAREWEIEYKKAEKRVEEILQDSVQ